MVEQAPTIVLAVTPGTRHLGFAVLEGGELLRFGVKTFPGRKTPQVLWEQVRAVVEQLRSEYAPQRLIVEDVHYAQRQRCPLLRDLTVRLKRWGKNRGLDPKGLLPTVVKQQLSPDVPTRRALADAMVRRYGLLARHLRSRCALPYWLQMFDAVALGVVAARRTKNVELHHRSSLRSLSLRNKYDRVAWRPTL